MDFQHSSWAGLWAICQLFPLRSCPILTADVSSLPIVGSLRDRCSSFCRRAPVLPRLRVCVPDLVRVPLTQRAPFHSQVTVKNGGADQPSASELTSFPGMYNGYKWPDIYTDNLNGFVVAGPNVVSFADDSSSDPTPPSSSVPNSSYGPSSTAPRPYSTSTPANPSSTSTCRTRKSASKKRSFSFRHIHRRSSNH